MSDRLLVIDTATAACSVALFEDRKLLANDYVEIGRGHAEKLVPMISALPQSGQAENILVNCGPGSFTGARIGISVAKALALAWNADLKGYQCLQLVAAQQLSKMEHSGPLFVCMLAGHGEFFVQNYSKYAMAIDQLESLDPANAISKMQSMCIVGSGSDTLRNMVETEAQSRLTLPNASSAILLSNRQIFSDIAPIYVREPDALKSKSTS